ncbi:rCG53438, partial [Rattus norvegicus]
MHIEGSCLQAKQKDPLETKPADTLVLDFCPLKLQKNKILLLK